MLRLAYLVPLSAMIVAALSLFISPGDEIRFARVLGGPTDDASGFRGRIQVQREESGVLRPEEELEIVLTAHQGGLEVRRELLTGPDGWVDFEVPRKPGQPLSLVVEDNVPQVLTRGEVRLSTAQWLRGAKRRDGGTEYRAIGALSVCAWIPKGVVAVPFETEVRVHFRKGPPAGACSGSTSTGLKGLSINASVEGGTLVSTDTCVTDQAGWCLFRIRPFHHNLELTLSPDPTKRGTDINFILPVVPGALSFRKSKGTSSTLELEVLSPVNRPLAWYTLVSEGERGRGGPVVLSQNPDGTAQGSLRLENVAAQEWFLLLASDADARSSSSVGYPLGNQGGTLGVWDAYLLDGAPRARLQRQRRQLKVRYALGGYAALSLLVSLVLFFHSVKREQRDMDSRLRKAGLNERGTDRRALPLVVAIISVFFVFSLTLVWIVTR